MRTGSYMNRRTLVRRMTTAALAVALIGGLQPVQSAFASDSTTEAYVRGAHFSPDTAAVDVYLSAFSGGTSTLWLSSVGYGDVSAYRPISPGVYAVSMRPHGAAASTPAALSWTVSISAGSSYTAAAVGTNGQLRGIVLRDSNTPPTGHSGSVRVIQASSAAGHVAVKASNGSVLTPDIAYGAASSYVTVPTGTWTVDAQSTTTSALTDHLAVSVATDSLSSVVVLDNGSGGLTMRTVVDAAGTGTVPTGSVSAGGGGTATSSPTGAYLWLSLAAGLAAALVLALGLMATRRRRELRA
jgi:hypothetical protein